MKKRMASEKKDNEEAVNKHLEEQKRLECPWKALNEKVVQLEHKLNGSAYAKAGFSEEDSFAKFDVFNAVLKRLIKSVDEKVEKLLDIVSEKASIDSMTVIVTETLSQSLKPMVKDSVEKMSNQCSVLIDKKLEGVDEKIQDKVDKRHFHAMMTENMKVKHDEFIKVMKEVVKIRLDVQDAAMDKKLDNTQRYVRNIREMLYQRMSSQEEKLECIVLEQESPKKKKPKP